MRTSSLVTVSLPPMLLRASEKIAKQKHMSRSELMRAALRNYLEEVQAAEAVAVYTKERQQHKLKKLTSLKALMS